MAIEKEIILKTYTVTTAALLAFIGAVGETIDTVKLDDRIEVVTKIGTNPITYRTYYVSIPEAKTAIGIGQAEQFHSIDYSTNLIIITRKQTI